MGIGIGTPRVDGRIECTAVGSAPWCGPGPTGVGQGSQQAEKVQRRAAGADCSAACRPWPRGGHDPRLPAGGRSAAIALETEGQATGGVRGGEGLPGERGGAGAGGQQRAAGGCSVKHLQTVARRRSAGQVPRDEPYRCEWACARAARGADGDRDIEVASVVAARTARVIETRRARLELLVLVGDAILGLGHSGHQRKRGQQEG